MNELFVGISCLPFSTLNPRFESHFHAGDNIYDTAPWGNNTVAFASQLRKKRKILSHGIEKIYTRIVVLVGLVKL